MAPGLLCIRQWYILAFQGLCDISSDPCILWTIFLHISAVEDMSLGRNSVGEERLTILAMMNIHRDIHLDINEIIDRFASRKRKIQLFGISSCKSYLTFLLKYFLLKMIIPLLYS